MSTETRLRAAYEHLAETAPPLNDLELDLNRGPARDRARAKHARGLRIALAGAVVVAIAVAAGAVAHRARPVTAPPASPPVSPSPQNRTAEWEFGPDSLPGYQGDDLQLDESGQTATYFAGAARANLVIIEPSGARRARVARLDPVRIRGVAGWVGQLTQLGPADCGLFDLGAECPGAIVVWALSESQWAVMTASRGYDRLNNKEISVSEDVLLRLANSLRTTDEQRIAFARVGYLPVDMRLQQIIFDRGDSPSNGYDSAGFETMRFSTGGEYSGAQVNISIVHDPTRSLTQMSAASLAALDHPGPWTRATVHGHLAWLSPTDILIQWGALLVAVDNGKAIPGGSDTLPATPQSELLHVADSLTVPTSDAFGAGYPLANALPPGTAW